MRVGAGGGPFVAGSVELLFESGCSSASSSDGEDHEAAQECGDREGEP